jgi:hypothetical protein
MPDLGRSVDKKTQKDTKGDVGDRKTEGVAWLEGTSTLIFIVPYCSIAP